MEVKQEQDADINIENHHVSLQETSQLLIKQYSQDLKTTLLATMNAEGAPAAVSVCSKSAPEMARLYNVHGWSVKRVSDRFRNPENTAGGNEEQVLRMFFDSAAMNSFDEFVKTDSSQYYAFYKPIRMSQLCLNCHGAKEKLDPAILSVLEETYPTDMAIGYHVGDLRGMFVVQVRLPEGLDNREKMNELLSTLK